MDYPRWPATEKCQLFCRQSGFGIKRERPMLKMLLDKFANFAGDFYDCGAGWAGRLGSFFKLSQLGSRCERYLSKRPAILGVELFVSLSLAVNFYFLVRPTCLPGPDGNAISRQLFSYLSEHVAPATKQQIQLNWRKRLAGPMLSSWLLDRKFKGKPEFPGRDLRIFSGFTRRRGFSCCSCCSFCIARTRC